MKQTMKYLNMAYLVAVGAIMMGCSKAEESLLPEDMNNNNSVILSTTVGFDAEAETRALGIDYENKQAVKTFAAGETMAIVYKNKSGNTVKAVSAALTDGDITTTADPATNKKSATFTFELTDPDKDVSVTYIYPAAMANDDGTVNYAALAAQDGTLGTLSSSLDLATFSDDWNGTSLPAGTLVNQLAVCALTLKDNATPTPNTITSGLTEVTVSDGSNTYTVARTSGTFGEDVIYVAIRPVTAALQYTATDGTKNYTKTATSREYAAGNFYKLGLRMVPVPALNLTSPAVGQVIGDDGKNYNYASLPGGVTAVAKICYVSGSTGLALALADEGQMIWSTAISTCAAHTPAFTNGTWKLATQEEWNNMITAAGGYTALRDGFSSVGGSNLQSAVYWSSTEKETWYAWSYNFVNGNWGSDGDHKYFDGVSVRACLAWTQAAVAPAAKAAAEATAEDKGKLIGTDGKIYDNVAAATAAGTTAVAKIIYIGTTGHATYNHGLALALTDEASTMAWQAAIDACSAKNTSTPVTGATWLLASKDQWDYMMGANGAGSNTALRDGFSGITGASNLQTNYYWSSTVYDSDRARIYGFYWGDWGYDDKVKDYVSVRACLAF